MVEIIPDIDVCNCGRSWCEFFDSNENVSYSREGLEEERTQLKKKLDEIDKALKSHTPTNKGMEK